MKRLSLQRAVFLVLVVFVVGTLAGCQTLQGAFNRTKEMLGVQKRNILISEVRDARIMLGEVKVQFQSSMDMFRSVFESNTGKLEKKNSLLKSEYKKAGKKAVSLEKGINSVAGAVEDLFAEWETELNLYTIFNLRTSSEQRLQEAKGRNRQFLDSMMRVHEKSALILTAFSDLVLFSRHNLNSGAIDFVNSELVAVNETVNLMIQEIEVSISEADALVILMEGYEEAPQDSP